jgi:hypothetical protein
LQPIVPHSAILLRLVLTKLISIPAVPSIR